MKVIEERMSPMIDFEIKYMLECGFYSSQDELEE